MNSDSPGLPPAAQESMPSTTEPLPVVMATVPLTPVIKPPLTYTQKVTIAVGVSVAAILLALFIYVTSQILILCFAGLLFAVFLSAPADLLAKQTKMKRGYALVIVLAAFALLVAGGGYFMGYTISKQSREMAHTMKVAIPHLARDLQARLMPAPATKPASQPASQSATGASAPAVATASGPAKEDVAATGPAVPGTQVGIATPEVVETPKSAAASNGNGKTAADNWIAEELSALQQGAMDFFFSESFVKGAGGVAGGVVSSTFGVIGNIAIVLMVGLFFALTPRVYTQGFVKLIPVSHRSRVERVLASVGTQLEWWFVGQLCSMFTVALLTFIGLSVLGVPMAVTLAILAGLLNIIPNFGPLIAAAPAVLIAFAPHEGSTVLNPVLAGWVILLYVIIQLLEGWVITPFFQQRTVELPPALIVVSQVVFALLLGPIGLLLATPILAATIVVIRMVYVEDVLGDVEKPPGKGI